MQWFCDCQAFPVYIVLNQSPHRKWLPWETTVVIPNTHSCWMLILMLLFPNKMIWWINVEYPDNEKENLSCKPNQRQIMVQKMAPENSGSRPRKGFFLRTKTKECSYVVSMWGYSWFLPNHSFMFQLFWHGQHLETIHIDFFCFFSKHNCYFLRNRVAYLFVPCPAPLIVFLETSHWSSSWSDLFHSSSVFHLFPLNIYTSKWKRIPLQNTECSIMYFIATEADDCGQLCCVIPPP